MCVSRQFLFVVVAVVYSCSLFTHTFPPPSFLYTPILSFSLLFSSCFLFMSHPHTHPHSCPCRRRRRRRRYHVDPRRLTPHCQSVLSFSFSLCSMFSHVLLSVAVPVQAPTHTLIATNTPSLPPSLPPYPSTLSRSQRGSNRSINSTNSSPFNPPPTAWTITASRT